MAVTIVQKAIGGGSSGATLPSPVTIGNVLIFVDVVRDWSGFATISKNVGGVWSNQSVTTLVQVTSGGLARPNSTQFVGFVATATTQQFRSEAHLSSHSDAFEILELSGADLSLFTTLTVPHDTTHLRSFNAGSFSGLSGEIALGAVMYDPDGPYPGFTNPTGWTEDYDRNIAGGNNVPSVGGGGGTDAWFGHIAGSGASIPTAFSIPSNGYNENSTHAAFILFKVDIGNVIAQFAGTPLTGTGPLEVDFTDTSTGSPDTWLWDFGDGETSTTQNPTHVFADIGSYTVSLTATRSSDAATDTETKATYVTVVGATADFVANPVEGFRPLSVQFTNQSTGLGSGAQTFSWQFGDGTLSTEENPIHVYTDSGLYTVTLTVNAGGAEFSVTKEGYITVKAESILPALRDRILLSIRASYNDENLYNHALVVASGNKAQIYYGEAMDTDPDSPTRIDALGDRVIKIESDRITTQATANKAALKAFLDNCLVSEDISLDAICNPALEGNDVIGVEELDFSKLQRNFRIQSFTIPLSSSRQTLKLARVVNLQTQTVSVNDDIFLVGYEQTIKSTAGTSAIVNVPVDTTDGDLILIHCALDSTSVDPSPVVSGFTSVTGSNRWKQRIAESEPSTRTVSWTGSRRGIITMLVYRNVDQGNPIAGLSSTQTSGKEFVIKGITLPSAEYHLVASVEGNGVTNYDWDIHWTEIVESDTGGTGITHVGVSIADRPRIGANPPGVAITAGENIAEHGFMLALRKDIS